MKKFLPVLLAVVFMIAMNLFLFLHLPGWQREAAQTRLHGEVIYETLSDFAHVRVRERDRVRSLIFVDKNGSETMQSKIDLDEPAHLQLKYSRAMFVSLLFRYPQEDVLIVGLGGGGMVRFLNRVMPDTRVDAVEIDPAVVEIAATYFGTENGPRTTIHTEDAFVFLGGPHGPYDAIYMDAFLRPPADKSSLKEKEQRLRTAEFLKVVSERLKPDGVIVFNLIEAEATTEDDLAAIRVVFPSMYLFDVPGTGNLVVIGTMETERVNREELMSRAEELPNRLTKRVPLEETAALLRSAESSR